MARRKNLFFCKKCGAADKTSHAGLCLSCYNKEYYQKHKNEIIQKAAEWVKNNHERANEISRNAAKRRYASLSKEARYALNKKMEATRSEEAKARRIVKARERYQRNKWRIKKKQTYKSPCNVCGKADEKARYISGKCKSCYSKERYKILRPHPDKFCVKCGKQISKYAWFDKCKPCRNREKYQNDPEYREKILAQNIRNNRKEIAKEKKRIAVIRRRGLLAKVESTLTLADWKEILERYNHRCAYCGTGGKLEKDHVIPVTEGGPTTKDNIVPSCRSCNSKKNNKIGVFFPRIYDSD